jgi:hypothetical protein
MKNSAKTESRVRMNTSRQRVGTSPKSSHAVEDDQAIAKTRPTSQIVDFVKITL